MMDKNRERLFTDYHSGYATQADLCKAFTQDTKVLYLLSFLLTTNHLDAERCFTSTLD